MPSRPPLLVASLAVGLFAMAAASPAAAADAARPNIVLILADDLGPGDLGCYGQKLLKTPNIDRLAAQGLRFTNAYAGAMVCAPSRCALMTGRHMGHATIRGNWEVLPEGQWPLKPGEQTVAMMLQKAGYATGICGKWGLGGPGSGSDPLDKGFDFFFGYNCQRHAHRYYTDYLYRNRERIEIKHTPQKLINSHDLLVDESIEFIRRNKARPFFLYCSWTLPHGLWRLDQVPSVAAHANTDWTGTQKVYATMVDELDADVGRVSAALAELELDQKTLVIFSSDNGAPGEEVAGRFGSAAGLRGAKGVLYEGGIRVPMIARWPGRVPAGKTTDFCTAFWDFLPTAAELAGVKPPADIDGISIVPTLLGRRQKPHDYLYWEQPNGAKLSQAVRMGRWKSFLADRGKPLELYDLESDPAEAKDVAAEHADIVARAEAIIKEAHVETEIPKYDPKVWDKYKADNKKLDAMLERLKSGKPGA